MEFYDSGPSINNLYFPVKVTRVFIRYFTRMVGYRPSLLTLQCIVKIINKLEKLFDLSYISYLFEINIYQLRYRISIFSEGLKSSVKVKNEWAYYTITNSKSMRVRLNAKSYLSLMSRHGFNDRNSQNNVKSINPSLLKNFSDNKFYLYGPNVIKPPNKKYSDYTLVVLKPMDYDISQFQKKLLFVNGGYYWAKMANDNDHCIKLINDYGRVVVSSLSNIKSPLEKAKFPMSGNIAAPMALGRILYNLIYSYGRFKCVIEGFDFYLDKTMYSSSYPSLARQEGLINEQWICYGLSVHDALYNFLYVKELCNYLDINDSYNFKGILKMSGDTFLQNLQKVRNFNLLKK